METWALLSAASEFACTTLEISLIPSSTDATISDCCALASAISSISVLMDWMHSLMDCIVEMACFVDSVPVLASCMERLIRTLVLFAASEDLAARFLTSSDTTEKPFPAAPARAASTEALRARRLPRKRSGREYLSGTQYLRWY